MVSEFAISVVRIKNSVYFTLGKTSNNIPLSVMYADPPRILKDIILFIVLMIITKKEAKKLRVLNIGIVNYKSTGEFIVIV
jgi:hypothetical protein